LLDLKRLFFQVDDIFIVQAIVGGRPAGGLHSSPCDWSIFILCPLISSTHSRLRIRYRRFMVLCGEEGVVLQLIERVRWELVQGVIVEVEVELVQLICHAIEVLANSVVN
jgi:hypothetical protein